MRKVHMFEAKSGDVLAVDIYGPNGAVLLAKGVKTFLKYVAIYPLGTNVVLNTGYRGVVSNIFPEYPLRPVVRILQNPNREVLKSPFEIDLRKEVNVTIVEAF